MEFLQSHWHHALIIVGLASVAGLLAFVLVELRKITQMEAEKKQVIASDLKILSVEGKHLKQVNKLYMFDQKVLDCTESGGMCKGKRCGHYRENVNGVDICRFMAIEFVD